MPPTWVGLNDNVVKRFAKNHRAGDGPPRVQGYEEPAKGHRVESRGRKCPQSQGECPGLSLVGSGPESVNSSLENLSPHIPGPQSPLVGSQQVGRSEVPFQF